jgi:hypothetical protein
VLSVATSLGCSSSVSHDCAGIGASGPAAATPEAARDAYLRTLLPQQTDIDYSAWKQVAESETSVSFRAPVETPALTVPGGQKHGVPYLLFVGKGDYGRLRLSAPQSRPETPGACVTERHFGDGAKRLRPHEHPDPSQRPQVEGHRDEKEGHQSWPVEAVDERQQRVCAPAEHTNHRTQANPNDAGQSNRRDQAEASQDERKGDPAVDRRPAAQRRLSDRRWGQQRVVKVRLRHDGYLQTHL